VALFEAGHAEGIAPRVHLHPGLGLFEGIFFGAEGTTHGIPSGGGEGRRKRREGGGGRREKGEGGGQKERRGEERRGTERSGEERHKGNTLYGEFKVQIE
jgi:hypothetical protein